MVHPQPPLPKFPIRKEVPLYHEGADPKNIWRSGAKETEGCGRPEMHQADPSPGKGLLPSSRKNEESSKSEEASLNASATGSCLPRSCPPLGSPQPVSEWDMGRKVQPFQPNTGQPQWAVHTPEPQGAVWGFAGPAPQPSFSLCPTLLPPPSFWNPADYTGFLDLSPWQDSDKDWVIGLSK